MAFVYLGCTKEVVDVAWRRNYWHLQKTWCKLGGSIATIFWDRIAQDSWGEVCREAVGAILSGLNLGQWQDSMMKQSLDDLTSQFRVVQGQRGFFRDHKGQIVLRR